MPGRATTVGGCAAAALGVVCLLAAILSGAGCGGGPSRDGGEPALPTTGVVRVDGGDIRGSVDGSVSIYRGVDDPNAITAVMDFPSAANAKAFASDPSLKEAMSKAGVTGPPQITFVESAG